LGLAGNQPLRTRSRCSTISFTDQNDEKATTHDDAEHYEPPTALYAKMVFALDYYGMEQANNKECA
jgi:hypothetical protein